MIMTNNSSVLFHDFKKYNDEFNLGSSLKLYPSVCLSKSPANKELLIATIIC